MVSLSELAVVTAGDDRHLRLKGVQVHITDASKVNLTGLQFLFLQVNNELYPDKNPFVLVDSTRIKVFDKVAGTDQIRKLFMKRMMYADIVEYLQKDVAKFKQTAQRYQLY